MAWPDFSEGLPFDFFAVLPDLAGEAGLAVSSTIASGVESPSPCLIIATLITATRYATWKEIRERTKRRRQGQVSIENRATCAFALSCFSLRHEGCEDAASYGYLEARENMFKAGPGVQQPVRGKTTGMLETLGKREEHVRGHVPYLGMFYRETWWIAQTTRKSEHDKCKLFLSALSYSPWCLRGGIFYETLTKTPMTWVFVLCIYSKLVLFNSLLWARRFKFK